MTAQRPAIELMIASLRVLAALHGPVKSTPDSDFQIELKDDTGSLRFHRLEEGEVKEIFRFRKEHIDDVKQAIIDLGGEIPEDLQHLKS